MIPFILIGVALAAAAAATAGEEEAGTADLLLALPVTRGLVLVARALALTGAVVGLAALGWVTLVAGTTMVDLDVSTGGQAAGAVMTGLLGLLYGTLGLLLGALTGRRAVNAHVCPRVEGVPRGLMVRDRPPHTGGTVPVSGRWGGPGP
jgi:ABC-2 type transport system permease protein